MKEIGEVFIYDKNEAVSLQASDTRGIRSSSQFILVPYKSISIRTFEYPFGSISRIREALKMQYSNVSEDRGVEIFPAIFSSHEHRYCGSALVLSSYEMEKVENDTSKIKRKIFWPLTFALAHEVNGNGAVVCSSDDGIISTLFVDGVPVLYRWQPEQRKDLESETLWMKAYCRDMEVEVNSFVSINITSDNAGRLVEDCRKTVKILPHLMDYNLSRRVLDSAVIFEKVGKKLSLISTWLILAALLFGLSGFFRFQSLENQALALKKESIKVYKKTFGSSGRVRDPLSQAKLKLRDRTSAPNRKSLEDGLRIISRSWVKTDLGRISIDSLRYGEDGVEIVGTATEVSLVQNFQKRLKKASTTSVVHLGDIQQVPGGGLRYSLDLRWHEE